jgi:signal transducing adaptor molecule
MAGAVYFISIPGVTNGTGGSRRASGNASGMGTEQSQQVQPQSTTAAEIMSVHALKSHGSSDSTSLPYPGDYAAGYAESPNNHSQSNLQHHGESHGHDAYPQQGPGPATDSLVGSASASGSGVGGGSTGSPSAARSTPSWVLPKKTSAAPVGQRSGTPLGAGAGGSSSYPGMQNQFAGMSVSDASG